MFTGLVQAIGKVQRRGDRLLVQGCESFSPLMLGDSIAVDGVCLTVSELSSNGFLADVSEETFSRTTLGAKADIGAIVNLEPALKLSDRLGGHLVSGHVDGLGEIISIQKLINSWNLSVRWKESAYSKYICEKASISLNGISLTVASLEENGQTFFIAVIPHTWSSTALKDLSVGDMVNLEADMMAKYAEKLIYGIAQLRINDKSQNFNFSKDWLNEHGWI